MTSCAKILPMGYFEIRLDQALSEAKTTLEKVCLSVGESPNRIRQILYMTRPTTFDKRLEALHQISKSPLLPGDFLPVMGAFLAKDYLPKESMRVFVNEKYEENPELRTASRNYKKRFYQKKLRFDQEKP